MPENNTFLLLVEAVQGATTETIKPEIMTVRLKPDLSGYDVLESCPVDFELTHANKGFESIQYLHTPRGSFLLGLCEGNSCMGGAEGKQPGNGRIVVAQLERPSGGDGGSGCVWTPVKTIDIPSSAYFQDYSGFAYNPRLRKLAVLSQEDAAVWVRVRGGLGAWSVRAGQGRVASWCSPALLTALTTLDTLPPRLPPRTPPP